MQNKGSLHFHKIYFLFYLCLFACFFYFYFFALVFFFWCCVRNCFKKHRPTRCRRAAPSSFVSAGHAVSPLLRRGSAVQLRSNARARHAKIIIKMNGIYMECNIPQSFVRLYVYCAMVECKTGPRVDIMGHICRKQTRMEEKHGEICFICMGMHTDHTLAFADSRAQRASTNSICVGCDFLHMHPPHTHTHTRCACPIRNIISKNKR